MKTLTRETRHRTPQYVSWIYNGLNEVQKFIPKNWWKSGQRKLGKKKTLTSISSARALSRLFSFWLFNKESYFLTFFDMWRKFPFLVWCKMRCKQHMQSESRTKAYEKRQHFAGGLSLFGIGSQKHSFSRISRSFKDFEKFSTMNNELKRQWPCNRHSYSFAPRTSNKHPT